MSFRDFLPAPILLAAIAGSYFSLGSSLERDLSAIAGLPEISVFDVRDRGPESPNLPVLERPSIDIAGLVSRPLFSETRQPYVLPDAEPTVATVPPEPEAVEMEQVLAPPPPDLTLLGLMVQGEKAIALLRDNATSEETWAALGSEVQGWTISVVESRSVSLSNGDEILLLKLFD